MRQLDSLPISLVESRVLDGMTPRSGTYFRSAEHGRWCPIPPMHRSNGWGTICTPVRPAGAMRAPSWLTLSQKLLATGSAENPRARPTQRAVTLNQREHRCRGTKQKDESKQNEIGPNLAPALVTYMKIGTTFTLTFLATIGWACGNMPSSTDAPSTQDSTAALTTFNGTTYNGISYGGLSLSWAYHYGFSHYGPSYYGLSTGPSLQLDPFNPYAGIAPNGQSLSNGAHAMGDTASDLVGLQLTGALEDGTSVTLTVESAVIETTRVSDMYYYEVEIEGEPLCGLDNAGHPIRAIAVPGKWDTRAGVVGGGSWSNDEGIFTFACAGSSIEKCVGLGYHASMTDEAGTPAHLLTCVRMLRADYCGDGTSWTEDGRMIEVWDWNGINYRTEPDWQLESGWTLNGASCLGKGRLDSPDIEDEVCKDRLAASDCSEGGSWMLTSSFWDMDEGPVPSPSCDSDVCDYYVNSAGPTPMVCRADSTCRIEANSVDELNLTCEPGTSCELDCNSVDSCTIDCQADAECHISRCNSSTCNITSCSEGVRSCGEDRLVCNRDC